MKLWGLEPAMIIGAITAFLSLAVSFGIDVSTEQQERIKDFANAAIIIIGAIVVRQQVAPTAKIEAAFGRDAVAEIKAVTKAEIGTQGIGR